MASYASKISKNGLQKQMVINTVSWGREIKQEKSGRPMNLSHLCSHSRQFKSINTS